MKTAKLILLATLLNFFSYSQSAKLDSTLRVLNFQRDSTLKKSAHADSVKVEKEYAVKIRKAKLKESLVYPVIDGGENSGIIPVKNPTEIPDPQLEYKLLFDIGGSFPDSLSKEISSSLAEVARIINLHVASGIPVKKIVPVIIARGGVLNALTTNEYYKEHFKSDNPNTKLINDLAALGTKFIACGQAMAYMDLNREALLPIVKITLTAQTVFSSYQLQGYVRY